MPPYDGYKRQTTPLSHAKNRAARDDRAGAGRGGAVEGHFGLAVKDYTHSSAPNRRYPDIIMQRLLKKAVKEVHFPYEKDELQALAHHCTEKEDAVKKVERQVIKSATAILLEHRIGERFDALVTGASDKGTCVRLLHPPVVTPSPLSNCLFKESEDLRRQPG
jgi:exoribonuclease R